MGLEPVTGGRGRCGTDYIAKKAANGPGRLRVTARNIAPERLRRVDSCFGESNVC